MAGQHMVAMQNTRAKFLCQWHRKIETCRDNQRKKARNLKSMLPGDNTNISFKVSYLYTTDENTDFQADK